MHCELTYKKYESFFFSDAINAAGIGKFTVDDREIQAQMYFPCLGLPEQPMN